MNQNIYILLLIVCVALLFTSCNADTEITKDETTFIFEEVSASKSNLLFQNTIIEDTLINYLANPYIYGGGGVAIGDLDNDGLLDIILGSNQEGLTLYKNIGNLNFEEKKFNLSKVNWETEEWTTSISLVDLNADGNLDIYVCKSGLGPEETRKNKLFTNLGNWQFEEEATKFGIDDSGHSINAIFFDKDRDNDLDLFIVNHPIDFEKLNNIFYGGKTEERNFGADQLYENTGNGKFINVTEKSGIKKDRGFGWNVSVGDFNSDNWPDLFLSNDFWEEDELWINNRDGTFSSKLSEYSSHTSLFSMGTCVADINNDLLDDILVVDMRPSSAKRIQTNFPSFPIQLYALLESFGYLPQFSRNMLFINSGNNTFHELAQFYGLDQTEWSWGIIIEDFDLNGWNDIVITNGLRRDVNELDFEQQHFDGLQISFDSRNKDQLAILNEMRIVPISNLAFFNYNNKLSKHKFSENNLHELSSGGIASGDLDQDGDLDIVINNLDTLVSLLENKANETSNLNYLKIKLRGPGQNPQSIGASVTVFQSTTSQKKRVNPKTFLSYSKTDLHFGFPNSNSPDSLLINWPDGKKSVYKDIGMNQVLEYDYANSKMLKEAIRKENASVQISNFDFVHKEGDYKDNLEERLLPKMLSKEGPGLAVADINQDGFDDFYIGNGAGESGVIGIYDSISAQFKLSEFELDFEMEITTAHFFDANSDSYPDLYLGSGSFEFSFDDKRFVDKLFINNGNGAFALDKEMLTATKSFTSSVISTDFDNDNDLDLFVGSRAIKGAYPYTPSSYLLINDSGHFRKQAIPAPQGENLIGMVTAATWVDVNSDKFSDLVVLGDFMMPEVYLNQEGKSLKYFENSWNNNLSGWWRSIEKGDFDRDGDMDLILGNHGLNSNFTASSKEPITIYRCDIDDNGVEEPLMFYYETGREIPFVSRKVLLEQVPELNNKFYTNKLFSKSSKEDIISHKKQSVCFRREVSELKSVYLENLGNGDFKVKVLPKAAQQAPINTISSYDFNNDSFLDIFIGTNSNSSYYEHSPETGNGGLVLYGKGNGEFYQDSICPISNRVNGVIKKSIIIDEKSKNEINLILGVNNSEPLLIQYKRN